jgi:hypothetical protein
LFYKLLLERLITSKNTFEGDWVVFVVSIDQPTDAQTPSLAQAWQTFFYCRKDLKAICFKWNWFFGFLMTPLKYKMLKMILFTTNDHCNRSSFPAIPKSFKFYFKTINKSFNKYTYILHASLVNTTRNKSHKDIIKTFDKIHFFLGVKLCDWL